MPTTSDLEVAAWRPPVCGIREVFHAHITNHVYPMHTHDSWTLLIVDDGIVRFDVERHEYGALNHLVTILPPQVAHNGDSVSPDGFRKRVLYLDPALLGSELIGAAADQPVISDPVLRQRIHLLHTALDGSGEPLEAESRLDFIVERLHGHLAGTLRNPRPTAAPGVARRLRDLLDARLVEGITLAEASELFQTHPTHLVRAFTKEFGVAPHQYLTGRRVDKARELLLEGMTPGLVAAATGFYDQSHFTRHFKNTLGTSPGRYARSATGSTSAPGISRRRLSGDSSTPQSTKTADPTVETHRV
ncbi:helix-turn-helix domain-containing protein [Peterkaempfera bronchialis]|uniref:helix-turn-helix domain-containing protein n=1 Tax=Peterkaempfera bronchialis TaxID=2126346 RepID=UPI001E2E8083|nr:AraC family transcriptional regulator [Peterkaempfera bronchialis]